MLIAIAGTAEKNWSEAVCVFVYRPRRLEHIYIYYDVWLNIIWLFEAITTWRGLQRVMWMHSVGYLDCDVEDVLQQWVFWSALVKEHVMTFQWLMDTGPSTTVCAPEHCLAYNIGDHSFPLAGRNVRRWLSVYWRIGNLILWERVESNRGRERGIICVGPGTLDYI